MSGVKRLDVSASSPGPQHLPYGAHEDQYYNDGTQRVEEVATDIDDELAGGSDEADADRTGAFAGAVAALLATRLDEREINPASSIPSTPGDREWFDRHIASSYETGRDVARVLLEDAGHSVNTPSISQSSYHQQAMRESYKRQRTYWSKLSRDLRSDVKSEVGDVLSDGGSMQQAREVADDRIRTVGLNRARKITHSEPAWAFNRAIVEESFEAGAHQLDVDMSWETAGDSAVCEECASRSGLYKVTAFREMMSSGSFPPHTLCRCVVVPAGSDLSVLSNL